MKDTSRPSQCGRASRRRRINNYHCKRKLQAQKRKSSEIEIISLRNKRKKPRGNDNNDVNFAADPVSRSLIMADSVITYEILSRLPVKSLMRFKCVCKHLKSLIQEDPRLIDLHVNRSKTRPCLFAIYRFVNMRLWKNSERERDNDRYRRLNRKKVDNRKCFLSAEMVEGRNGAVAITRTAGMKSSFSYDEILKPINGLICFINREVLAVRIYNVSTHEVTRWIKSNNKFSVRPMYYFGYSPATKEHKVICISSSIKHLSDVTCEILTVGDGKWRGIDAVPPYDIRDVDHVYANGSIYWCNLWQHTMLGDPEFILAFDVGCEKFRKIHVPMLILDALINRFGYMPLLVDLVEIDGCLTLQCRVSCSTVKLWIFADNHDSKENTTAISATNSPTPTFTGGVPTTSTIIDEGWTEESITLPRPWHAVWILDFHDIAGTDQILIESGGGDREFKGHIYDRKKKTFKKVKFSTSSSQDHFHGFTILNTFSGSLFPVHKKLQCHLTQPQLL